jgi:hypothetical protein
MDLSNNQLSGNIPTELANGKIGYLDLHSNLLTGNLPAFLSNQGDLVYADFSNNLFEGNIPSAWSTLYRIEYLYLSHNKLTGPIPNGLGQLTMLRQLKLSDNQLTDSVPASLTNLRNLDYFYIDNNQLIGITPTGIGQQIRGQFDSLNIKLENNRFNFDCIEAWATIYDIVIGNFNYSPQAKIPLHFLNGILSVYAGGTLASDTFRWYNGNMLESIIIGDSTYKPQQSGSYSVQVTNNLAKKLTLFSDTLLISSVVTDINDLNNFNSMSVFPNPAKDEIVIHTYFPQMKSAFIFITTIDGKVLYTSKQIISPGAHNIKIPIEGLTKGVCLINMSVSGKVFRQKIILQ